MDYADGAWYASTLGHFIGLLVDSGNDPVVCFQISDEEADDEGKFVRNISLFLVPNGYVTDGISRCRGIHKTLRALLDAGIIK